MLQVPRSGTCAKFQEHPQSHPEALSRTHETMPHMRIKVNRIGAQGGSVANAASAVIDYLMGKDPTAEAQEAKLLHQPDVDGEVAYYADAVEGPGQWLGSGAEYWSLEGDVDEDSFRNVLLGRHPHTGERMVSARGSAERSHLRVGQFTATSEDGAASLDK